MSRNRALRSERLQLVIPSSGALGDDTLEFLASVGAKVERETNRRYTAHVPSLPGIDVTFQRQSSIPEILDDGNADFGIVGMDRFLESSQEEGDVRVMVDDLRFGRSSLVIAVPFAWRDIRNIYDLADRASEMYSAGHPLRIATKYRRLARQFLRMQGITYFEFVDVDGALEAAPNVGSADAIADITDTGNTLRANGLRQLPGGKVMDSVAVLVGNSTTLAESDKKLRVAKHLLERIEASFEARNYRRVTTDVPGDSERSVADMVRGAPELAGLTGPTVSKVWPTDGRSLFSVQVVVRTEDVQRVVDHMRENGGGNSIVSELAFLYRRQSRFSARLPPPANSGRETDSR